MARHDVLVCSFHTDDEYYRRHGAALRANLDDLGVSSRIDEVPKDPRQDWADICRKKVAFLAAVCEQNPDKKVFWIDVDCSLADLPAYVADFSADIIGFQRGFGSPFGIGYGKKTRFWEPCFLGINATPGARKFIADAAALERAATIKATDDYFLEESWRANAPELTFQVIPSLAVASTSVAVQSAVVPFFTFGSSGSVGEFKDKVVQHDLVKGHAHTRGWASLVRRRGLRLAKAVERRLPDTTALSLRKVADTTGITHLLTGGDAGPFGEGRADRDRMAREMLLAGQAGDVAAVDEVFGRLSSEGIVTAQEIAAQRAALSFAWYATRYAEEEPIRLAWWPRPYPGNFGDWLSPLVFSRFARRPIRYQSLTARGNEPHVVGIGSVARFIRPSSIVVGTGVNSEEIQLDRSARFVSVRGPVTARLLRKQGGPAVESMGDPGILLSRLFPAASEATNGRVALVRHFKHRQIPVTLPENMDELEVLTSHPDAVRQFVAELCTYEAVVTSAMHVMIACHSYGIPCALITFEGFESAVHGTGVKYRDYSLGAALDSVYEPVPVKADLRRLPLDSLLAAEKIAEEKLDEVELAVTVAIDTYLGRIA